MLASSNVDECFFITRRFDNSIRLKIDSAISAQVLAHKPLGRLVRLLQLKGWTGHGSLVSCQKRE